MLGINTNTSLQRELANSQFLLILEGGVAQDAATESCKRKQTRTEKRQRGRKSQDTFNWTETKRFKLFWFYSRGSSSTLAALVKSAGDFPLLPLLSPDAFTSIEFGSASQETHCYSLHGFTPKKLRSIYSPRCSRMEWRNAFKTFWQ
jgi:hypothetical protein